MEIYKEDHIKKCRRIFKQYFYNKYKPNIFKFHFMQDIKISARCQIEIADLNEPVFFQLGYNYIRIFNTFAGLFL